MDIISELPDDVKDKILECLPTRDAARTTLLSTHWKDVWLRHERLVFDTHFFECLRKCEGDKPVGLINVINHILLHRAAPVKKFSLCISCPELEGRPKPQQSDIDFFYEVEFKSRINGGVVSDLEKLSFHFCVGINNFKIRAPKLKSLDYLTFVFHAFKPRWLSPHHRLLSAYCLYLLWLDEVVVMAQEFPTTNLQVIWVIDSDFGPITIDLELLERSPNLCELKFQAENMLYSIPNFEKLVLDDCEGIRNLEIKPPKHH
ncbi:PREDICTED: FBD-associated F-box protein At5g38590-like [Ipomoea nil]|uniref:FBD-associated F-box protein At5g38590-like n=1 Tax=Ipomoea nil TaxID=35883 RepID=UPI00090095DB|nr:PREDICTED: FBD-associated F-box protein At5g38590-like [Ipomoea nil]